MKKLAISAVLFVPFFAHGQLTDIGSSPSNSVLGVASGVTDVPSTNPALSAPTVPSGTVPTPAPAQTGSDDFVSFGPFTPNHSPERQRKAAPSAPSYTRPAAASTSNSSYQAGNAWRGETNPVASAPQTYGRSPASGRLNWLPKITRDSHLGYTFVELLYDYTDFHGVDDIDDHGRGYTIRASYSPVNYFYLNAWLSQSSAEDLVLDAPVDLESISAGVAVGAYLPVTSWFHLTAEVGGMYTENSVDTPNFSFFDNLDLGYEGDDSGLYALPGVRLAVGNRIELAGQVLINETDIGDDTAYIVKAYLEMIPTCDLALGAFIQDDVNRYSLGARFKW